MQFKFDDSQSYLLVIESMKTEYFPPINYSWEWKFRLKDKEFFKCLYLASFMQKNSFPSPERIIVANKEKSDSTSALHAASAIKYAMGPNWGESYIDNSYGFINENNVEKILKSVSEIDKEGKFFVIIIDNVLNYFRQYCETKKSKTGEGILFWDNSFKEMITKLETKTPVDFRYIGCDESLIPNTFKLQKFKDDFEKTLDRNSISNPWSEFKGVYDENFYEEVHPNIVAGKGKIMNQYSLFPDSEASKFTENFFNFVQTFKKTPYNFR